MGRVVPKETEEGGHVASRRGSITARSEGTAQGHDEGRSVVEDREGDTRNEETRRNTTLSTCTVPVETETSLDEELGESGRRDREEKEMEMREERDGERRKIEMKTEEMIPETRHRGGGYRMGRVRRGRMRHDLWMEVGHWDTVLWTGEIPHHCG